MEYKEINDRLAYFRYREKFKLTYAEFVLEPIEEINFAIAVWENEAKRDKLEIAKQEAKAQEQRNKTKGRR